MIADVCCVSGQRNNPLTVEVGHKSTARTGRWENAKGKDAQGWAEPEHTPSHETAAFHSDDSPLYRAPSPPISIAILFAFRVNVIRCGGALLPLQSFLPFLCAAIYNYRFIVD